VDITAAEMIGTEDFRAGGQSLFLPCLKVIVELQDHLNDGSIDAMKTITDLFHP
jgi:hypothetical protein